MSSAVQHLGHTGSFQGEVWSLRPAAEPYAITLPQERTQERGEGATESAAPLFITLTGARPNTREALEIAMPGR